MEELVRVDRPSLVVDPDPVDLPLNSLGSVWLLDLLQGGLLVGVNAVMLGLLVPGPLDLSRVTLAGSVLLGGGAVET